MTALVDATAGMMFLTAYLEENKERERKKSDLKFIGQGTHTQ
jgi:hypothetical protein